MGTFLDKNERRDLGILYRLYYEDKVWSAEELAKASRCSIKSITNSVNTLNGLIDKYHLDCRIESERHSGIRLVTQSFASIYQLKTLYVQNTVTYQLMDTLFQGSHLSIEKLQQRFFLSRSSIYRKLSTIEKLFNENGFVFSKTELTITGPESSIREFFYLFYVSVSDEQYWPFQTVTATFLEDKLIKIAREASLNLSYAEKVRLLYRMAVNTVRYQQKKYITELPPTVEIAPNLEFILRDAKGPLLEGIPSHYQELEFRYITLLYLTYANSIEVDENLQIEKAIVWHQEQQTKAYSLVSDLLSRMMTLFPELDLTAAFADAVFIHKLLSVASYALLYPRIDVDLGVSDRWNKRFKSLAYSSIERPKFTDVLWRLITEIHEEQADELINPHHVFYFIYSIFNQTLDLRIFEHPLKIKLMMEVGYLSESELKQKLYRLLPTNIEIVTSEKRYDETVAYDLVISDLPHLVLDYTESRQHYIWSFPPTKRDWRNIKKIMEIQQLSRD